MRELSGPTWRRLKACLEYKFKEIPVPATGPEDRVKTLGLLVGLSKGDQRVLKEEHLQLQLGSDATVEDSQGAIQDEIHRLAGSLPLEDYLD